MTVRTSAVSLATTDPMKLILRRQDQVLPNKIRVLPHLLSP